MKAGGITGFFAFLAVFLFILVFSIGFAAPDPETMDVNVTIGEHSEITVSPNILNWTDVDLGAAAGVQYFTVENTGSVNVTDLYVYGDALTDEIVRPYGLDNASNYSAAGVITLSNLTGNQLYFLGRIEWNWTEIIQNINTENLDSPVSWGFFRNTSNEYVWAVGNGTDGLCNNTGAQFMIEADIDQGTEATRTPAIVGTRNFGDADYSYFSVDSGPLTDHCVAVNTTCERIYIYKYDKRSGSINTTQCTNAGFLTAGQMVPGNKTQMDVDAYIPKGIPVGEMNRSTLTFVAT